MKASELPSGERVLPVDAAYDRWAKVYDSDGNPLTLLEEPEVQRALGEVRGLDVVDVGCGTGRHTAWLAKAGARVTALDFSEGMLEKARAKVRGSAVRFVRHDLALPLPLPDASFDRVLSGLVLEHIADLGGLFRELRRVCRPGGAVVVSAMHPAMMLQGVQAGFTDEDTGEKLHPRSYRHQVSDFVMAALDAGLELTRISEHPVDEALAARAPRAEKYLGWLLLLLLSFRPR